MPDDPNQPRDLDLTRWQGELVALLEQIEAAQTPEAEAAALAQVARLGPDLQRFLVERMAEHETPETAAFLEGLAAQPATPAPVRDQARAALARLGEYGVAVPAPGVERFYAGWVQLGRERGEQIMILGWRLPAGRLDALVFLLDWRGDGLKDFYRTREMSDEEWRALLEHNGRKGAPLTEITLTEGRALLEEALAEGRRYSRPLPREYRLSQAVVERRVLDSASTPDGVRQYVSPDLDPVALVGAYLQALHYRDYLLAWELLAPEHPLRGAGPRAEAVEALRRQLKQAPRRRPEAAATPEREATADDQTASVLAEGAEETTEQRGRRVRQAVRERFTLRRTADGWRIAAIERLSAP
jgi:hypothetical protein